MPQSETQAWWADVQHVRESIERRRARAAGPPASADAAAERRFVREAAESLPPLDDVDWVPAAPSRSGGRFDHTGRPHRADTPRVRSRRPDADHPAERRGLEDERLDFDAERSKLEAPPATERAASRASRGAPETATALEPPARRTVQITGRTVAAPSLPRLVEVQRRRPARRPAERVGPHPDRIALWAVLLGFFLILVAATSAHAAPQPAHAAPAAAVVLHAPAR
jgi:hypothetical protein